MQRKQPPTIKIYEALWAIADGRIEIIWFLENEANIQSSSGNKSYIVKYDEETNSIIANDNGSYWQWYLWYPAIAFLMKTNKIPFDKEIAQWLKWIPWKDLNTQHHRDYDKVIEVIHQELTAKWYDVSLLISQVKTIEEKIKNLDMQILQLKMRPPKWY